MTARQADRRRRVIAAARDLVAAGRVRDVQVKEIADAAGVSLAAIYRYFSSKEHLMAEALLDWAQGLTERRPAGPPGPESFARLVRRGVSAYRREPQYAELFLEVAASRDPYALACFGRMSDGVTAAMDAALADVDPALASEIVRVIGNAWLGGLFDCVHRRSDFAALERSLDAGCRLLLAGAGIPA